MSFEWFERNPNKMYIAVYLSLFVFVFLLGFIVGLSGGVSDGAFTGFIYLLYFIVMLPTSIWVLRIKNQSMWWLLLMGFFSPLLVPNKGKYSADFAQKVSQKAELENMKAKLRTQKSEKSSVINGIQDKFYTQDGSCKVSGKICSMEASTGTHVCDACKVGKKASE